MQSSKSVAQRVTVRRAADDRATRCWFKKLRVARHATATVGMTVFSRRYAQPETNFCMRLLLGALQIDQKQSGSHDTYLIAPAASPQFHPGEPRIRSRVAARGAEGWRRAESVAE